MLEEVRNEFLEKRLTIENILISQIVDEFYELYKRGELDEHERMEYLEFINTLFKVKHKFILDYRVKKEHPKRDMKRYYLKKIEARARLRLKKYYTQREIKELSNMEDVAYFKRLIRLISRKARAVLSERTKNLLQEILKEKWTIKDKMKFLKLILNSEDEVNFRKLIDTGEKEEIVKSFAAMLDMMKKNEIEVMQERNFGEIIIKRLNQS